MAPKLPRKLHPEIKGFALENCDWIPNWTEAKHYEIDETKPTHMDKLAWELLRRNREFQDFCQRHPCFNKPKYVGPSPSMDAWGLVSFKRYDAEYSTAKSSAPKWVTREPELVVDRRTGPGLKRSMNVSLDLEPWQVAAVFDLRHPLMNATVLDSQIAYLRETLLEVLSLRGEKTEGLAQGTNPQRKSLSIALRVADAMQAGVPRHVIGRRFGAEKALLQSAKQDPVDLLNEDWSKAIFTHVRNAHKLIYERGYLRMLLRTDASLHVSQKSKEISAK